jgi:Sulfotransferase family
MQTEKRPILVTGAHRTGTTWVGRLLSAAPNMTYVSEPLNVLHRPGVFRGRVRHWYTYICDENGGEYLPAFRELLGYRYHLGRELAAIRTGRDVLRMFRDAAAFSAGRLRRSTAVLKDPFAVFSLLWFAQALHCRIVVTVRHPAAFASGLKRLGWSFDFSDLLQQPLLMRDHLGPYRAAMTSPETADTAGQAGLLWAIIYDSLDRLRAGLPGLQVVRHEDLALEPETGFRQLYAALGLQFTRHVERAVASTSSPENPAELSKRNTHSVKMDSRASLQNWKRRLSNEEITRLRRLTDGVVQRYYSEESWQ